MDRVSHFQGKMQLFFAITKSGDSAGDYMVTTRRVTKFSLSSITSSHIEGATYEHQWSQLKTLVPLNHPWGQNLQALVVQSSDRAVREVQRILLKEDEDYSNLENAWADVWAPHDQFRTLLHMKELKELKEEDRDCCICLSLMEERDPDEAEDSWVADEDHFPASVDNVHFFGAGCLARWVENAGLVASCPGCRGRHAAMLLERIKDQFLLPTNRSYAQPLWLDPATSKEGKAMLEGLTRRLPEEPLLSRIPPEELPVTNLGLMMYLLEDIRNDVLSFPLENPNPDLVGQGDIELLTPPGFWQWVENVVERAIACLGADEKEISKLPRGPDGELLMDNVDEKKWRLV
ncbi:hypothetical protein K402DRAFT_408346 [Aulographum hederae CBS 113979]|uniref:Uncharacterized protein n=1 Tax=Aulographum hederae CBS 113979 TaxID=1176131 RepID=A0A6G1GL67_9PEZI|nr:hypothetical protein K402DRAFT_408346 [Aulographum hederae CBS 113979]